MIRVKLYIHEVNLRGTLHSIVEFASNVVLTNEWTSPRSSSKKDTIFRKQENELDCIKFEPLGFLCPIINDNFKKYRQSKEEGDNAVFSIDEFFRIIHDEEGGHLVLSTDEFLYFPENPLFLESSLKMKLLKSGVSYNLQLDIVRKRENLDLDLFYNKILNRWCFQINKQCRLFREKKDNKMLEEEKFAQSIYVMKTILGNALNHRMKVIENLNQVPPPFLSSFFSSSSSYYFSSSSSSSLITLKLRQIFELEAKKIVFECEQIFFSLSTVFDQRKTSHEYERSTLGKFSENMTFADYILPSSDNSNENFRDGGVEEEEFDESVKAEFITALKCVVKRIKNISESENLVNSCSIMPNCTTINDLRDPFLYELFQCGKTAFLRFFTVTGIPILAERVGFLLSRDSPWNLSVILDEKNDKYRIVNSGILDSNLSFEINRTNGDRSITMEDGITFNAIVPIFTPGLAQAIGPLLKTRVFESICSYTIFRNSQFVYRNAHLAGLVCIWIKFITIKHFESPNVGWILDAIIATASSYFDSPDVKAYIKATLMEPIRMMEKKSESNDIYNIKAENLAKPLFFAYVFRHQMSAEYKSTFISVIVKEFIGRLISKFARLQGAKSVRMRFFMLEGSKTILEIGEVPCSEECFIYINKLAEEIAKKFQSDHHQYFPIRENERTTMTTRMTNSSLLSSCLPLSSSPQEVESPPLEISEKYCDSFLFDFNAFVGLNEKLLFGCKDEEDIGDFNLGDLKVIAEKEFNIPETVVSEIFNTKYLFRHVYFSANVSDEFWRTRWTERVISYEDARALVYGEIRSELKKIVIEKANLILLRKINNFNIEDQMEISS